MTARLSGQQVGASVDLLPVCHRGPSSVKKEKVRQQNARPSDISMLGGLTADQKLFVTWQECVL